MRRFVIDANTLASGSVDPHGESPPCLLYGELAGTRFEAILWPELPEEVAETLRKPYFLERVSRSGVADIVGGIAEAGVVLEDPAKVEAVLRDSQDDYLVALARGTGAEAIETCSTAGLKPPAISPREACEQLGLID